MALIPSFFFDCVVAIGTVDKASGEDRWIASGFLYGELEGVGDEGKPLYRIFLVTNRHVFENLQDGYVRFNPEESTPAEVFSLGMSREEGDWWAHPDENVDVAVTPMNVQLLRNRGIRFSYFCSDKHVLSLDAAKESGLSEGDGAYVLGFPLGLVGGERNFVVARQATIARIRDALAKASKEFLVDALIFPGNSGGPVVTRPEVTAIEGTKAISSAYLVGVVSSYIPFRDIAMSTQTNRPRVIFEENSGLASVVPINFVQEVITAHIDEVSKSESPADTSDAETA